MLNSLDGHTLDEYRAASTPALHAAIELLITERAHGHEWSDDYRRHVARQKRRITQVLNERGLPARLADYRAGAHLWRDNFDFLDTLRVHTGYARDPFGASWRKFAKHDLATAMGGLRLAPGHTYRVYLLYRTTHGPREFMLLEAARTDTTACPAGNWYQLGKIEL